MHTFRGDSKPVCPFQFHSYRGNIDNDPSRGIDTLYKTLMPDNMHMISKNLPGEDFSFSNCTWLAGTAFHKKPAKSVFQDVLKITNNPINKTTRRLIPLSVCPCINASVYSCHSADLGSMFSGQTITIRLLVEKKWLKQDNPSITLKVANTSNDDSGLKLRVYGGIRSITS